MAKYRPKVELEIVKFTEDMMDGVDFFAIGGAFIKTMTKAEYQKGLIPKTNRRYWIDTASGMRYITTDDYIAHGVHGKFVVTEEQLKNSYEKVEG